jgi:large subunit ribosomal protein L5
MSRLRKKYKEEIKASMQEKFSYKSPMQVPVLQKIVISMGVGEATKDKKIIQDCVKELAAISGQKPIVTKARLSIANFKLREGQEIGLKVTLRGKRMYDFFDRFTNIVCPRIRDFRGFKKRGDGRGAYTLGLDDHQVFPELKLDEVKREQGMNITFVTNASNEEESLELLRQLGLPFMK